MLTTNYIPNFTYLTNGCGEDTGRIGIDTLQKSGIETGLTGPDGRIIEGDPAKHDYPLSPREAAVCEDLITIGGYPFLGCYSVLHDDGYKCHLLSLELSYRDPHWGSKEDTDLPSSEERLQEIQELAPKFEALAKQLQGEVHIVEDEGPGRHTLFLLIPFSSIHKLGSEEYLKLLKEYQLSKLTAFNPTLPATGIYNREIEGTQWQIPTREVQANTLEEAIAELQTKEPLKYLQSIQQKGHTVWRNA